MYYRFFGAKKRLTDDDLRRFTELDFDRHVGLVATLRDGDAERIVGTLLLEHLAAIARTRRVTEFEADVLGENNRMLDLFGASGFVVRRALEGGVVHVSFPTAETPVAVEAAAARFYADERGISGVTRATSWSGGRPSPARPAAGRS